MKPSVAIKNKKALYLYEIFDEFVAGIVLMGSEIKSLRSGKASLVDAYCVFRENELWIRGLHISEYKFATQFGHEPKRDRKLLLNRMELKKLQKKVKEKGLTIVALKIFISDTGLAKLDIALARGKSIGDKRESLKKKDAKRDLDRLTNS